ncbi:MAG TPA: bifunctional riboflavin kinase/FAD synthetase [Candidatus Acidoferrum sp.]|nr:bifunctional riboflavin kinase/FAD synthetase [Candidatus Acidoferrum sp.]
MGMVTVRTATEWASHFGEARPATAVTIGNFDGVHCGHQKILLAVADRARDNGWMSAVLTFDPHPVRVLRGDNGPYMLSTLGQRLRAFEDTGIDATLLLQFDEKLSHVSPEDFARTFLCSTMRARAVLVGENFRFGHRQAGDVRHLTEFGREMGFEVSVVPPVMQNGIVVSSTAIRQALREGRVHDAHEMLGRPYAVEGRVARGTGTGGKLVVPTLNLETPQEMLPKMGVYATKVRVQGKSYHAVTNIGMRPTFDGKRLAIESHLFDFSETITEGPLEVRFWQRLRDEKKFSGPEELKAQILQDIETAQDFFARADR